MTKTKTVAAFVCALSLASVPALTSVAFAQGAPEPMKGAEPMSGGAAGGSMEKGGMEKGGMSKSGMSKKSMSKKSMKKHKKMM